MDDVGGRRWAECSDVTVGEAVRQYSLERFSETLAEARATAGQAGNTNAVDGWRSMLSAGRERSVLSLARGIVERQVTDLDRDLDLLNTPSGVVDLTTGELLPHDRALFYDQDRRGRIPARVQRTGTRPWRRCPPTSKTGTSCA